jgi:hypothetical protein
MFFRFAAGVIGVLAVIALIFGQGISYKQKVYMSILAIFFVLYSIFGERAEKLLGYLFH